MNRRACHSLLLALACIVAGGCTVTPLNDSRLMLRGDSKQQPAEFRYREMHWRPTRDFDGGIDVIGYGMTPFYNDPISRDWDPRWPRTGFVVFRILIEPKGENQYVIKMLGPSMSPGPGDDEVLTVSAQNVQLETAGDQRILHLADVPTQSRNHPDWKLSLSGTIIATPTSDVQFERDLKQFDLELSYRGPARK